MERAIIVFAVFALLLILFILAKIVIRSRRFRFMVFKKLSLLEEEPDILLAIQKQREHVQKHVTQSENAIKYFQEEIEKEREDIAQKKAIVSVLDELDFAKKNAIMRSEERISDLLSQKEFKEGLLKAQRNVLRDYDYLLDGKPKTPLVVQTRSTE